MHFRCQTKVNDDMEFQYYKNIKKNVVDRTIELCNYMSFAIKWMK
jgi:hypothetical protein